MRRRHSFWIGSWIVPWIAIGLSACTTLRPPVPEGLETAKACAEWRWIGISRSGTYCPAVPGWTVRPLFAKAAFVQKQAEDKEKALKKISDPDPDPEVIQVIKELDRFCLYEIEDPKKGLEQVPFPPAVSADLVQFDQDC